MRVDVRAGLRACGPAGLGLRAGVAREGVGGHVRGLICWHACEFACVRACGLPGVCLASGRNEGCADRLLTSTLSDPYLRYVEITSIIATPPGGLGDTIGDSDMT